MLSWCGRNGVDYIVGIARNKVLAEKAASAMDLASLAHRKGGGKMRLFADRTSCHAW